MLSGISSLADVKDCQTSGDLNDRKSIPDFYMPSIEALKAPIKHVSNAAS